MAGIKPLEAQEFGNIQGDAVLEGVAVEVQEAVPTFKIDAKMGPPWVDGDVLKVKKTGELLYVRTPQGPRTRKSSMLGMRGTGGDFVEREADPGWVPYRKRKADHEDAMVVVPFMDPMTAQVVPVALYDDDELIRVGKAYNEAGTRP